MIARWIRKHRLSLIVGLATTGLGCLAWSAGWLSRIDNAGLDWHFKHCGRIEADPRVVLVDIDDFALESAPYSFPWPRRVFAEVVGLLHELGAKVIVLDIVFDTADEPRQVDAALGRNYDLDTLLTVHDDALRGPPMYIMDDDELAAAFARAGNVLIPMFFEFDAPVAPDREESGSRGADDYLTGASERRRAARQLAGAFLDRQPTASCADFLRANLPEFLHDRRGHEREDLIRGFRGAVAERELRERSIPVPAVMADRLAAAFDPTFPLEKFARSCRRLGFAGWDRETVGPVVREIPLLANLDGRLTVQLGLLTALEALGADARALRIGHDALVIPSATGWHRMSVDANGASLINWHVPPGGDWSRSFTHLPIARLLEVLDSRAAKDENVARRRRAIGELVALRYVSTPAELQDYVTLIHRRRELENAQRLATTGDELREPVLELIRVESQIARFEEDAREWLEHNRRLWSQTQAQTNEEIEEKKRILALYDEHIEQPKGWAADPDLEPVRKTIPLVEALRDTVKDRICFVGYTASAQVDLVATPVHPAMPGVMVHANIVNTLLWNRPAWRASTGVALGFIGAISLLTVVLSVVRGGVVGALASALLLAAVLALGAAVFRRYDFHLPSLATCMLAAGTWSSVTLCRQLTEERARRRFQAALAQYTAPAVAAQIANNASMADLAPRSATVSCFFADLEGFTTLSERLGPERTQRVLNPFLKEMSRVLIEHGAMVNKFMGDAVFAFFNAPILPCKDHAAAACRSALAAQKALGELNRSTIEKEIGSSLKMRIGITTGEAFVGDYGSDTKLDYTCIGDTVNTANRLQAANKEHGTNVLVDENTQRTAIGEFEFRSLGPGKLTGKATSVNLFELKTRS